MLLYKLSPRSGRNSKFLQPLNEEASVLHLFVPQLTGLSVGRIRALNDWRGGTQNMPISPAELEEATERVGAALVNPCSKIFLLLTICPLVPHAARLVLVLQSTSNAS